MSGTPPHSGDFEVVGERVISATWVTFAEATVRAPNGEEFKREIVHHPGAVSVVPLLDDDKTVILVRQYRAALGRYLLELPAGKRDVAGEPPLETARRELLEETGMRAERLDLLCTFYNSPGISDEHHHSYLARSLKPESRSHQSVEEAHMSLEHVSLVDLPSLIADSVITDAKSIIGLLMAQDFLARKVEQA